jgi:hypothetical protein
MNAHASRAYPGNLAKCVFKSQITEVTEYGCLYQTHEK